MKTVNYPKKKTYEKYDNEHFLLYLSEQQVTYLPETDEMSTKKGVKIKGFSYTGTASDGGTLIQASEDSYGAFVSGLIRTRYTTDDTEALQANAMIALQNPSHEKAESYLSEWEEFQSFRNECKKNAKKILNL
ncbi:hypothetical protein EZS27_036921 [termite gut metagenome]|uniref:Uncharacterized protein n=1 Tax=termite gut metagenome TaxID=433724 RepID=A0A5J4PRD7_9ZZZZ